MTTTALYILYSFLALGAAGLYLGLPVGHDTGNPLRSAVRILGAACLAALATYLARWIGNGFDGRAFFVIFAIIAVAAAARVVTHPQPIYCALYFVLVVLSVTAFCVLAAAEFLAAALVIVYAGAILVTYIFVIMLSRQREDDPANITGREPLAAVTLGFLLAAAVTQAMVSNGPMTSLRGSTGTVTLASTGLPQSAATLATRIDPASVNGEKGNVRMIGETLMNSYVLAVEIAGVLLLVALVGAVALARKRIEAEAMTPEELALQAKETDLTRRGREAPPF